MKRRAFVVALAAAPWWIRRAFGDASVGGERATGTTPARATAGPTLVFVVPRDESARWERGAAFGDYLNHGSDRDLAPLALVDVVCAPAADYGIDGDPWMLLVDGRSVRIVGVATTRADKIAALVRKALPLHGESAALLAAAARERYVKKAPRGARWGRTTMCGNEYEEGPSEMVDCGMGHVPEPSRRFLDFYVKKS